MQPPELQFAIYALVFNDIQNEMSASRIMPNFAHNLTDKQFAAIFPTLDPSCFVANANYWLTFVEIIEVDARSADGRISIRLAERQATVAEVFQDEFAITYVHGVAVMAAVGNGYVKADFTFGNIAYAVTFLDENQETAKQGITELVNQIIVGGAAYWSAVTDPIIPELRNEEMTLEQARIDPDFGAFMPVNIPQDFIFDSGRRTLNQWDNSIRANWHRFPTFDNIFWTVAEPHEFDLERIVSANDRHKFDVSLYSIPWMDSVPSEIIDYLGNPVFLAEEMSLEIVQARAQWDEGRHGESAGWRIVPFGVLHGDVIIRISASGVSPEQIWAMLP